MRWLYLVLCVAGTILPYVWFAEFLVVHGLDLGLFLEQAISTSITRALTVDLLLSCTAFFAWVFVEGTRLGMRRLWVYVAATLLVGLSLGLPLFLYVRHQKLRAN